LIVKIIKIAPILAMLGCAVPVAAKPAYHLVRSVALGAPDRWDYAVFDGPDDRLYVAHGNRLTVLDGRSGFRIGEVEGIEGGTHGTAISHGTGQGYTDDGTNGTAVAFDLKTLKITHRIAVDVDADAVTIDPLSGHVFVVEGDPGTISVIDPRSNAKVATINGGEKMEYAVADRGSVFAAGEGKSDVLKIDSLSNKIVARWPAPDCTSPHGLAIDSAHRRLFMGCTNSMMMVVDADRGNIVAKLPIGRGSDAVAYDPRRQRIFSSNGLDGTITVYQQTSADRYRLLDAIPTAVSGRTMALDPRNGRLFIVAADTDPSATPGGRPRPRPGTLKVLFFDPAT
jgi:DNA-binding beta-propeller fold protein YncE